VLDSRTASLLFLSFRAVKNITTLSLYNAGLNELALKALEEGLPASTIAHLRLDYNPLDDSTEGVQALLKSFTGPTSKLISLSLRGNGLTDGGAKALAEGLKGNLCLQSLNLFGNAIGEEGGGAIAEALQTNTQLGNLSLASNALTTKGLHSFKRLFEEGQAKGLQVLNLTSNGLDEHGVRELLVTLHSHKDQYAPVLKALALHRNVAPPTPADFALLVKDLEPIVVTV
jgi:Ran GTPase-activating protein (RanGAP) involved in mRNA processing and transport